MNLRQLQARLDRLERSRRLAKSKQDGAPEFAIGPLLAKSLRDDYERRDALIRKQFAPGEHGGPPSAAELIEEQELGATLADRAKAIGCPVSYGPLAEYKDSTRLHALWAKRISPPSCGGGLTDAEDAEEAQLRARVLAFQHRTEDRKGSLAEKEEYNRLYQEDPLFPALEMFRRGAKRLEQEEKERAQQRQALRDKQRAPDKLPE
jgi:hypothetical protein